MLVSPGFLLDIYKRYDLNFNLQFHPPYIIGILKHWVTLENIAFNIQYHFKLGKFNNKMPQLPHLAVTMGDPAGIGPEIILKALADNSASYNSQITVVGNRNLIQATYNRLLNNGNLVKTDLADPETLSILDVPLDTAVTLGSGSAATGDVSFACLSKAIALTLAGEFQGIVTAPIAKSLWKAAGHDYPGQTEVLAQKAGVERFGMLFVARSPYTGWMLRTLLATTHIPLAEVSTTLTPQLMSLKLDLLIDCLQRDFGIDRPRIAIAGRGSTTFRRLMCFWTSALPYPAPALPKATAAKGWMGGTWMRSPPKQRPAAGRSGHLHETSRPMTKHARTTEIFNEDKQILEAQQKALAAAAPGSGFVDLNADAGTIQARRVIDAALKREAESL